MGLPKAETAAQLVVELTLEPVSKMADTCSPAPPHPLIPPGHKWLLSRDMGSLPESRGGEEVAWGEESSRVGLHETRLPAWPTNASLSGDHQVV